MGRFFPIVTLFPLLYRQSDAGPALGAPLAEEPPASDASSSISDKAPPTPSESAPTPGATSAEPEPRPPSPVAEEAPPTAPQGATAGSQDDVCVCVCVGVGVCVCVSTNDVTGVFRSCIQRREQSLMQPRRVLLVKNPSFSSNQLF